MKHVAKVRVSFKERCRISANLILDAAIAMGLVYAGAYVVKQTAVVDIGQFVVEYVDRLSNVERVGEPEERVTI